MVDGSSIDPDEPPIGREEFWYDIQGHFEGDGIEIDSIK